MTKKEAFEEINRLQDGYVDELISKLNDPDYQTMKTINFTSATGTGKTKMMSKLINKLPEYFFIVTTLSKGQLKYQIQDSLLKDCVNDNYSVYGSSDYTIGSILKEEDIVGKIPSNRKCIWLRDEGHIRTNRFEEILSNKCYKIINFSATNVYSDIQCNFMQTMMLRTVYQTCGSPEDAINKLIEVKRIHRNVHDYNPCAIFRCVSGNEYIYDNIVDLCRKHDLKYIDITDESFVMSELCKDDNQYDIIINKYKITEGIDIRRAHVLYMDNQPGNNATTIQVIGRCRRNALLYRKDIDILDPRNNNLLKETRKCYVYYNVKEMRIPTDADGNLQNEYCDHISCQSIKAGSYIDVENGQLPNGLFVIELEGKTGRYKVSIDNNTGFNYIDPVTEYYAKEEKYCSSLIKTRHGKIDVKNVKLLPIRNTISVYDNDIRGYIKKQVDPYYDLCSCDEKSNVKTNIPENIINEFQEYMKKYTYEYVFEKVKNNCLDVLLQEDINYSTDQIKLKISGYIKKNKELDESKELCRLLLHINECYFTVSGFGYQMKELCTKDELLLLVEFCTDNSMGIEDIEKTINWYMNLKLLYTKIKYGKEMALQNTFNNMTDSDVSLDDAELYVNEYLCENRVTKGKKAFCDLLLNITKTDWANWAKNTYTILQKCCSKDEQILIQYFCIKEKEGGASNSKIIKYLEDILKRRYGFNFARDLPEFKKLAYFIFKRKILRIFQEYRENWLCLKIDFPDKYIIKGKDIALYFEKCNMRLIVPENVLFINSKDVINSFLLPMKTTYEELKQNIIHNVVYSFSSLYEKYNEEERHLISHGYTHTVDEIPVDTLEKFPVYKSYSKLVNDRESAIVGADLMQLMKIKNLGYWVEATSVTSKINNYNKFNLFISSKYKNELLEARRQYQHITGKNTFRINKKCNSVIGYCVEYYSKYLLYGEPYLGSCIDKAQREFGKLEVNKYIIVRACMQKYREMMILCFGSGVAKVIKGISMENLIRNEYEYFVNLVVELGTRTAEYVKNVLYENKIPKNDIDPNLSIRHISGLADYITEDTILDVKVRNNIDEKCIKQVLAYHYLSTKRSDLHIKRVIVYDATSDKSVVVNISDGNRV